MFIRSLAGNIGPAIEHLIQADAAINPGSSGGPLLDSAGINTAIYGPSGASAGIGFAVPVDTVMQVVPQLIKSGKYIRPALGIEADEQINERLNVITGTKGIVVLRVHPGSAAEKAGLKGVTETPQGMILGNIIVQVSDVVQLTIMHQGKKRDLTQYCSVYKNKFNKINLLNIKNTPSNALSEQYWDLTVTLQSGN